MSISTSSAADLVLTDIDDAASLTRFLARHAVAPARQMWRLPLPSPDEKNDVPSTDGRGDHSPVHFGPVIGGLVIWSTLFPHAAPMFGDVETVDRSPNTAWLDGAFTLAMRTSYGEIRAQVDGLFGAPSTPDDHRRGDVRFRREPRRNDAALGELRAIQALLLRLCGKPEDWADLIVRYDTGLEHVDLAAAIELDTTHSSQQHQLQHGQTTSRPRTAARASAASPFARSAPDLRRRQPWREQAPAPATGTPSPSAISA